MKPNDDSHHALYCSGLAGEEELLRYKRFTRDFAADETNVGDERSMFLYRRGFTPEKSTCTRLTATTPSAS
ncbi:hypothetical protein [Alkalilimnicola ehrlichii]|uniref:hypothetical protein n=1 Tax=Alkalilimnicola ehrlichii TaxID=351052 RepID=UPI0011C02040|nr:hypothetical protein [Alkalilimnicola ehrlichii]